MKYDILFLVDSGIGNAIETLYSVEYCLKNKIKVGIFLNKISKSFQNYLLDCYGEEVILFSLENIKTKHLVHSFTYHDDFQIDYQYYFYVQPDANSSQYKSETEQQLEIVRALYPSDFKSDILLYLKENYSEKVKALNIEEKYVLYPGSTYPNAYKRWSHFPELISKLGEKNIIILGGNDDLRTDYSYIYPKYIASPIPQPILDNIHFWRFLKKIKLLKAFSHNEELRNKEYSYFNAFDWAELVSIFKKAKGFAGNDGGLSQISASVGGKGVVIFGATSVKKNKAINPKMKALSLDYSCQPCQFAAGGIQSKKYFINCPFQIKCLKDISVNMLLENLQN